MDMHFTGRMVRLALFMVIAALVLPGASVRAEGTGDLAARLLEAKSLLGDREMGRSDAPVVMIEYASATCPHCAEFHEKVLPQIKTEYIETGKVRFIFREFPLDQLAMAAFVLVRCVPDDKYFATLDLMFQQQRSWMESKSRANELFMIMAAAGMDRNGFEACLRREDLAKSIFDSSKAAANDFGIKSTPTIFINGKAIDAHDDMTAVKAAIDRAILQ